MYCLLYHHSIFVPVQYPIRFYVPSPACRMICSLLIRAWFKFLCKTVACSSWQDSSFPSLELLTSHQMDYAKYLHACTAIIYSSLFTSVPKFRTGRQRTCMQLIVWVQCRTTAKSMKEVPKLLTSPYRSLIKKRKFQSDSRLIPDCFEHLQLLASICWRLHCHSLPVGDSSVVDYYR